MHKLHKRLSTKFVWYQAWHQHPRAAIYHWAILITIMIVSSLAVRTAIIKSFLTDTTVVPALAQTSTIFFDCSKAPYASSPVCQGGHPRLHITQATLPYFQNKIATYYKSEYQTLINWVDANFSADSLNVSNNLPGLMADYHALIYLLGSISGITYGHSIIDYGDRAIQIMLNKVAQGVPSIVSGGYYRDDYQAVARAYDWVFGRLSSQDKTAIASWLADTGNIISVNNRSMKNGNVTGLFSSDYFGNVQGWYGALAIYNDGIRDADAQAVMDSFGANMLNGKWLDAQSWVARTKGGESEIGHYAWFHPKRHIVQMDGWRTATSENYFAVGTAYGNDLVRYYSSWIAYQLKPAEPNVFIKWGQTDSGTTLSYFNEQTLRFLGEPLKNSDQNMAALNRWIIKRAGVDVEPTPLDQAFHLILGDRSTQERSPQSLGLPLSEHFEGLGMTVMRSGFDDINDTAIVAAAPVYLLGGHSWLPSETIPNGFTIDKYGPLALRRQGYLRGEKARNNIVHFVDPLTSPPNEGFAPLVNPPNDIYQYTVSSQWERGGTLRIEKLGGGGQYDYLYFDATKNYLTSRVKKYTRQFVYLRPGGKTDVDYIIVFDRTETARPDIVKRWEISMAYDPVINGTQTKIADGKWQYTNNPNSIVIDNNKIDPDPYSNKSHPEAHGKLFVKTLLPQSVWMEKIGGPGHEFDNYAGPSPLASSDYPYLNKAGALLTGTYFVDVIPTALSATENFLHVLQTADGQNPTQSAAMVPTALVESQEGNIQGAFIASSSGQDNAVVLFAKDERVLGSTETITYTVTGSGSTRHLITDLPAGFQYDLFDNGLKIATVSTLDLRTQHAKDRNETAAGTLYFTSNLNGSHLYQVVPAGVVPPPNQPPTISNVSASPTSGTVLLAVQFSVTASDPDGTIVSYSWDFGDGTSSSLQNPSHTYTVAGTFTVTLTVTDNLGASAQQSTTVTVTQQVPPSPTPTALPVITISVVDAVAAEPATDTARLKISRVTSAGDLIVYYNVGGTATNGKDYEKLSGKIRFRAGVTNLFLTIAPVDDTLLEKEETIYVGIKSDTNYQLGRPSRGKITIYDNEN